MDELEQNLRYRDKTGDDLQSDKPKDEKFQAILQEYWNYKENSLIPVKIGRLDSQVDPQRVLHQKDPSLGGNWRCRQPRKVCWKCHPTEKSCLLHC